MFENGISTKCFVKKVPTQAPQIHFGMTSLLGDTGKVTEIWTQVAIRPNSRYGQIDSTGEDVMLRLWHSRRVLKVLVKYGLEDRGYRTHRSMEGTVRSSRELMKVHSISEAWLSIPGSMGPGSAYFNKGRMKTWLRDIRRNLPTPTEQQRRPQSR